MGLELHALSLIKFVAKNRSLGAVATIGRQTLALPEAVRAAENVSNGEEFCEPLLLRHGATSVESYDVSDYEQATHIADFNQPLDPPKQYDTILDFGSLEHIFDQKQAFANVRALAAPGALVCHVLPVNNLAGHGLWQYCSDLLYEVYSLANGFDRTRVFYASAMKFDYWYEAPPPGSGERTLIASLEPVIAISIAQRTSDKASELKATQAFYRQSDGDAAVPKGASSSIRPAIKRQLKMLRDAAPDLYLTLRNVATVAAFATRSGSLSMSARRSAFTRLRVDTLLTQGFDKG